MQVEIAMPAPRRQRRPGAALSRMVALCGLGLGLALPALVPPALAAPARMGVDAGVEAWDRGDYPLAVHEWQGPADKGDPVAQYNLAQAYKFGRGVPQDLARAEMLFARAAAQGHVGAADNYGLLLFQRGQHAQAMPYIRAAAEHGEPRAQYLLGVAHFNGENVPKDWVRAYALETLAQQAGLPQAKAALEQMDRYIPLEQRRQAVSLAAEMASHAQATRNAQDAATDLGTALPPAGASTLRSPSSPAPTSPTLAANDGSPRTAGADFTRPRAMETRTPAKPAAPEKPRPEAKAKPEAKPSPKAEASAKASSRPAHGANEGWKVQLGAFAVSANADTLWKKVKSMPEIAGHPRENAPTGKVTRLLAGGYSEEGAQAACRKLGAAGLSCLPTKD